MPEIQINNARYYYTDTGTGNETIVFAHGFLMDREMFRHQIEALKSRYRIIAFDWRGQGKSQVTDSGYDMDELYRDALALIEALKLKKPHWTGVSMGGFIGMRIAARHPDLLGSLVLADTSDEAEILSKKIRWGLLAYIFKYFGPEPIINGIRKALFGKSSLENPGFLPVLEEYAGKWMQLDREATFKIAWAIFNRKPVTEELKNIKIPTLVVVGDEDIARPVDEAERLSRRINNARMEIIPKAGHSSPLENPEDFNRILTDFLQNITPG